jgi:hypothetical protein
MCRPQWAKRQITGRYDPRNAFDRQLRTEIVTTIIKPALVDLPAPAARGGGVPTTPKGERVPAPAQPDKAPVDVTGRYETIHKDQSEELGKTMCINQAGTLRLFSRGQSQDTLRLVPQGSDLVFEWKQGGSGGGPRIYKRVQDTPLLFEQPVATLDAADRPLLAAYEWKPLLQKQIAFLRMLFGDPDRIGRLL